MPKYDFECQECKHTQEQSMSLAEVGKKAPDDCSECGSSDMKKVILTAPRTIYKGRGWFKTSGDYCKGSKNKVTEKEVEHYEATGREPGW